MRCHRSLGLFLAALVVVAPAAPSGAQPVHPSEMRPVQDPGGRFTISFPGDWRVQTGETPAVIGIAPGGEELHMNVNVVVEALHSPMTPRAYAEASGRQLGLIFHEYTVIQEGPVHIGGQSAYYRYFTWRTNNGLGVYQVQTYFTVARSGFAVTGTTLNVQDRIDSDLPVIARVINTFQMSKNLQAAFHRR